MLNNLTTISFWTACAVFCFPLACCCEFPASWNGTWYSSRRGVLAINSTYISEISTTITGPLDYSCYINSGSIYIIRSTTFMLHNALHRAYFCLQVSQLTTASIRYYHSTSANALAYNEKMKLYPYISAVTVTDICDTTPISTEVEMLVKEGFISSAVLSCPNTIRGVYNYTITTSGVTSCSLTTSSLDVCSDTTQLVVNKTLCNSNVAYSVDGLLNCVYSHVHGSYTYATVINTDSTVDETTTYRFTCLVSEISGDNVYVSQFPEMCESSQTPTSVATGGATLELVASITCPSLATQKTLGKACVVMVFMFLYTRFGDVFGRGHII